MSKAQCFVIGGGVVGMAVARALSRSLEVILLESQAIVGSQTSSRNSEVIHSGIYYSPGSLKSELAASGCERLYRYLQTRNVGHKKCGKIICATSEADAHKIPALMELGKKNGVEDLKFLTAADIEQLEPNVRGHCGVFVPSAGIVNSHELMLSLQADAEAGGALIVTNCSVIGAEVSKAVSCSGKRRLKLFTNQGDFETDYLINCAGHLSPSIAARIRGHPFDRVPRPYYCKGNYFKLSGVKPPFQRLVYPVPSEHGLGVHATIDMMGSVKFGPDTEWIEPNDSLKDFPEDKYAEFPDWVCKTISEKDYFVNEKRCESFYSEVRKYWPMLPDNSLEPDYSGIRPKISGPDGTSISISSSVVPGRNLRDFVIEGVKEHGVDGLVNLYGIESPGLTACLTIADLVSKKL